MQSNSAPFRIHINVPLSNFFLSLLVCVCTTSQKLADGNNRTQSNQMACVNLTSKMPMRINTTYKILKIDGHDALALLLLLFSSMMIILFCSSHLHCCCRRRRRTKNIEEEKKNKEFYIILDTNLKTKVNENQQSEDVNISFMANGTNIYSFETTEMSSYFLFAIFAIFLDLRFFLRLFLLLELSSDKMWFAVAPTFTHTRSANSPFARQLSSVFLSKCTETISVHYWALLSSTIISCSKRQRQVEIHSFVW